MGASVSLRILLVDDQALIRNALNVLLQSAEGIEVVAATDRLDEAERLAGSLQPDLVLLDIMTEAPTFECAGRIMRHSPTVKVVLLDEGPLDIHVREVLRLGAAGYLTKRQPFAQIESLLRQAARGDRVFAPEIARRLVLSVDGVRLSMERKEHPLAQLTPRETDVLIYLAQGYSVKQCAKLLGIGVSTVGNHKSRLMKKLDMHKTVDLARFAMREGLISTGRSAAPCCAPEDVSTPVLQ
jgi:DNA-binding NarL/FixJ family response regulator